MQNSDSEMFILKANPQLRNYRKKLKMLWIREETLFSSLLYNGIFVDLSSSLVIKCVKLCQIMLVLKNP